MCVFCKRVVPDSMCSGAALRTRPKIASGLHDASTRLLCSDAKKTKRRAHLSCWAVSETP